MPPPTFYEWVDYCFTLGQRDFAGESGDGKYAIRSRWIRFCDFDPVLLTSFMTRLFESPAFIAERFTEEQIADGIWFVFGCGSGYFGTIHCGGVPEDQQARCTRAVATMYTDLFDRVCGERGVTPDVDIHSMSKLDGAVYMIWDMGGVDLPLLVPDKSSHLVEPCLEVLSTVPTRCRTSACLTSAMHAIGHAVLFPDEETPVTRRVQLMVDDFLARRTPSAWLREYAMRAREGNVQ